MSRWIIVTLFSLSSYANACGCLPLDREKSYLLSENVFSARITDQHVIQRDEEALVSSEFSVVKVLKGDPGKVKTITSFTSSNSCWKPLLTGETYVFYSRSGSEIFYTKCGPHQHVGPGNIKD